MGGHSSILDHFEERSPDEGSTKDIFDRVDAFDEEIKRDLINDVFGKCVIFKVQ